MRKFFKEKKEEILLFFLFFFFYLFFQLKSIYGGDSGDLVTAAWLWGIPHPPGYPLYTLIASILIHLLPFSTPAWRVGLISSFSSALSLAIFYLLLKKISRKRWIALLGTLVLAFLYPVWLYSEVAEVFTLNNLFIVLLTYLFFSFLESKSKKKIKIVFLFFLFLGLSLAHHHTIVLLLPGFAYLIFRDKKIKRYFLNLFKDYKKLIFSFLFLFFGFLFYLYPLLVCRKAPLVCWDDPINFKNLFRLVSRADYGTFKSSSNLGNAPLLRLYSLASFFRLALEDFRVIGLILVVLGFYKAYKDYRRVFIFLTITLSSCLFFIFYASFILVNDFMVGTFERFLIFPYIFMALSLGLGVEFIYQKFKVMVKFVFRPELQKFFLTGLKFILFLVPFSLFIFNFKKISILKNDLTAEKMAEDFLAPLPQDSILVVSSDTTVFDLQYVRYVLGFRSDVVLISYPLLPAPHYQKILKRNFPHLILSDKKNQNENLKEFIEANVDKYSIFVDRYSFGSREEWFPYGLSLQYLPKQAGLSEDKQLGVKDSMEKNIEIWKSYSDPLTGSLKEFESLFLSDVLRIYQDGRINFADFLLKNDYLDEAEHFFKKAKELKPEFEEADIGLGAVWLKRGECDKAKEWFLKALDLNEKNALALAYLRKTALECFKNEDEAKIFENQCLEVKEGKGPKLTE